MPKTVKSLLGRLILSVFIVSLSGTRPASADESLRIATIPIDVGAEAFFADAKGFFKQAGLDVRIETMPNGSAIAAAVASGAVDVGFSSLVPLAIAHAKDIPITVVAPAGLYTSTAPTSACIVSAHSSIKTAKDLTGKTFATNGLKDIAEFGPRAWIDDNGGNSKAVNFVELPFPAMPAALAGGRVDAALAAEPVLDEAKRSTRVLANCFDAIGSRFLIGAYFSTVAWARTHPAVLHEFQAAMRETADWANAHQPESAVILHDYTKIPLAVAQSMTRAVYAKRAEPALMQPVIDLTARYSAIPATFPAADLIYPGTSH